MPWPPPTHIVSSPNWPSRSCRAWTKRGRDPRAGHAEGMTHRDRAAVHVEPVLVDAQAPGGRDDLRRERLVHLDEVDVRPDSPARARARCEASTGPSPMISGRQPRHGGAHDAGQRGEAELRALRSDITTTAAAPSFSGQALPAVTVPSGRNTGFSWATASSVTPARGLSSRQTTVPSASVTGVMSRSQNPSAARLLGPVLAQDGEGVLFLPADALQLGHVLRGLPHRQVHVRQLAGTARVGPGQLPR